MRRLTIVAMLALAACTPTDRVDRGHVAENCSRVDTITATFDGVTESHEVVCSN